MHMQPRACTAVRLSFAELQYVHYSHRTVQRVPVVSPTCTCAVASFSSSPRLGGRQGPGRDGEGLLPGSRAGRTSWARQDTWVAWARRTLSATGLSANARSRTSAAPACIRRTPRRSTPARRTLIFRENTRTCTAVAGRGAGGRSTREIWGWEVRMRSATWRRESEKNGNAIAAERESCCGAAAPPARRRFSFPGACRRRHFREGQDMNITERSIYI
jgi:hypothetical protein